MTCTTVLFLGDCSGRASILVYAHYPTKVNTCFIVVLLSFPFSFTNEIEAISCDDMFVDITKILKDTGATPFQFAQLVVDEIFAKTQCTASVGIGEYKQRL